MRDDENPLPDAGTRAYIPLVELTRYSYKWIDFSGYATYLELSNADRVPIVLSLTRQPLATVVAICIPNDRHQVRLDRDFGSVLESPFDPVEQVFAVMRRVRK